MDTANGSPNFPRGLTPRTDIAPLATSFWLPLSTLEAQAAPGNSLAYEYGKIWLGRTTGQAQPVGYADDRHLVTVAGSRSGKGTSAIIPALCEFPGSVICIDPKGENATKTATRRGYGTALNPKALGQEVYVLDPYRVSDVEEGYRATFDPLATLRADTDNALEEAGLIAEGLIIPGGNDNAHWDENARALIEALILHVVSGDGFEGDRTLGRVHTILRDGDRDAMERQCSQLDQDTHLSPEDRVKRKSLLTPFRALLLEMNDNRAFGGKVAGMSMGLRDMGERERGSVLSTARRNMKFLDAPRMQACLAPSDHALRLEDLKRAANGVTVYIVLPSRLMDTHSRWMRLILNLTVSRLEADPAEPAKGPAVLAILDEFPTLRHLKVMETAIGYMAGFGLKLWAILQDLSQLKRDYPQSWETFLGNAGMLQFFGNSDPMTLDFISKRLGEIEVIRETHTSSVTTTESTSDLSPLEKIRAATEGDNALKKALGSFKVDGNTVSTSQSTAKAETTARAIQKTALMTPDEIRLHFSRASQMQIIALADYRPLFLRRTPYYDDPYFSGKYR